MIFIVIIMTIILITKTFSEKMKCDVGLMIDRDVAEKNNENKVYRDVKLLNALTSGHT